MALALGTENKRQLRLFIILLAVIALIGGYEIYDNLSSPSTPVRTVPSPQPTLANAPKPSPEEPSMGPQAQKLTNVGIDPRLHFDILAQSEQVEISGSGRNIFSADTAPAVHIEQPVKSARQTAASVAVVPVGPPPPPKPPEIDLKYFGYKANRDKTLQAFFMHGEDIFVAKSGDIINRRFQIGTIRPSSVEVTDLAYKNTQNITLSPF
ncbi:hypothetical protein ACOBR2_14270 [Telmatobacter bradus]|uniref:hypothetical protein n=1 Tax=Telmatobacter bradus TaxID=474953 RepID=UPI003B437816